MTQALTPEQINRLLGLGYSVREGYAVFGCPKCAASCDTRNAGFATDIPFGLRFVDVPCQECGTFFTVEMVEDPHTITDE